MHSHLSLAKKAHHIFSYMDGSHPAATDDLHEEILHTLNNLHRIFPDWVICTCRSTHAGLCFVSDNCSSLLGVDADHFIAMLPLDQYYKRIHPADIPAFYRCMQIIDDLLQQEDAALHHTYRFVFHYRIQHANGHYVYLHDEKACLLLKNGQVLHYSLLHDIGDSTPFQGVRMIVFKEDGAKKILDYNATTEAVQLSKREQELVPLMRQGLSTKEIAAHLAISPHTVRNMRQKLFEKFQVNNAIELLNKVGQPTGRSVGSGQLTPNLRFGGSGQLYEGAFS